MILVIRGTSTGAQLLCSNLGYCAVIENYYAVRACVYMCVPILCSNYGDSRQFDAGSKFAPK